MALSQDGYASNLSIYSYLSCVGAKNVAQSLLRNVGQSYKEASLPSKTLWTHGICCSAESQ